MVPKRKIAGVGIAGVALIAAALAAPGFGVPAPAAAQSIMTTGDELLRARLDPGHATPDGARIAGLVLEIAPGWKTYWRSPGAVGVPPVFDWSASRNVAAVEVLWPRPSVIESFGIKTLGYSGEVVLPLRLVPEDPARAMQVSLDLEAGVCREVCVYATQTAALTIAPGAPDGPAAERVRAAEAEVPVDGRAARLGEVYCRIVGADRKRRFQAEIELSRPVGEARVALEGPSAAWFDRIVTRPLGDGRLGVTADLTLLDDTPWIDRSAVTLTLLAPELAVEFRGCRAARG